MKNLDRRLKKYIAQFPNKTESWGDATDEIRDLCRLIRTTYNDVVVEANPDSGLKLINALNFNRFKTPSCWNTQAKKMIDELWPQLSNEYKRYILDYQEIA